METSNKQTSLFTEDKSMSYQEGSPVNHSHQQAKERAQKTKDISGRRCLEQFGKFNRATLWARTFAALLIGQGDWYSTRCRLTWKLKATRSHRFYFQLAPSTLPTVGTGFGLLPTPSVADTEGSPKRTDQISQNQAGGWQRTSDTTGTKFGAKLNDVAQLLATPNQRDWKGRTGSGWKQQKSLPNQLLPTPCKMDVSGDMKSTQIKEGSMHSVTLSKAMTLGLLPTPATRDHKGGNSMEHLTRKPKGEGNSHQDQLANFIKLETGSTSQLNPRFVAEMMGFPPDYLELPFQSTEKNL